MNEQNMISIKWNQIDRIALQNEMNEQHHVLHLISKSPRKEMLQGKKPERNSHTDGKCLLMANELSDA
jgi:hypothetical protein